MFTKEHKRKEIQRKEIQQIDIAELELEEPADKTELLELQPVPERGEAKMLEGDSHEVAVQLLKLLRDEAISLKPAALSADRSMTRGSPPCVICTRLKNCGPPTGIFHVFPV